jgi:NAD(P)-dependent dehydrogenase (short-subunit alcohol dehydrogenase family)
MRPPSFSPTKGWNVVATMRDVSAAGDLAGRDNVLVSRLDVTDPASIDQAIKASIERFGKLDAVINNAGYGQYGIFETIPQRKHPEVTSTSTCSGS